MQGKEKNQFSFYGQGQGRATQLEYEYAAHYTAYQVGH